MTWQTWVWLGGFLVLAAVELTALLQGDRPGRPRTLTANIRWLITGTSRWHHGARSVLLVVLAWLGPHLLGGGT